MIPKGSTQVAYSRVSSVDYVMLYIIPSLQMKKISSDIKHYREIRVVIILGNDKSKFKLNQLIFDICTCVFSFQPCEYYHIFFAIKYDVPAITSISDNN